MNYSFAFFSMVSMFLSIPADAQSGSEIPPDLVELCQKVLCRDPKPVRLTLADGEVYELVPRIPTPIVTSDMVTVLPGETVHVEATIESGRLTNLVAVKEVKNPERTLRFHLKQDSSFGEGTGMILTVESPFEGILKYRLGMMLPDRDEFQSTSACPLNGGAPMYEMWPHPIFQIAAKDFHFVEPDSEEAKLCE